MCGFIGFLDRAGNLDQTYMAGILGAMTDAIAHRGPDDSGAYVEPEHGLALGFRRLSILDLSKEGHQPMASPCGRYKIVFNGEIYNFQTMKDELLLKGCTFRGGSDTEVILAGFTTWGVEATIQKMAGMFALALWDRQDRELWLARDRLGKKPLYYGWSGDCFLFGSELKGLRLWPGFQGTVDRVALSEYLRMGYVPGPRSIYAGIAKLLPGSYLRLPLGAATPGWTPTPTRFWDLARIAPEKAATPFQGSPDEAVTNLKDLLEDAVATRMVADVPVGAFLSGGIDSSLIVGIMQAGSARPVKTFSIGFRESDFNEAQFANQVASHLGTDHTEYFVTATEALEIIPTLAQVYDEPFADSSQIPTVLVSKLARSQVTVVLSGDGGDEVFGGYDRYAWASRVWSAINWAPALLRRGARGAIHSLPISAWNVLLHPGRSKDTLATKPGVLTGDRLHKLADKITGTQFQDFYRDFVSIEEHPERLLAQTAGGEVEPWPALGGILTPLRKMMCIDTLTNLTDDILVKVDRATMAHSLEARVPLLDHRIIEWAWSLPFPLISREGQGKWILRQLLSQYVPPALYSRPKQGFSVPLREWLRGPLRPWAEELLDPRRMAEEGYFNPAAITRLWQEHQSYHRNWTDKLWTILMFQAWLRNETPALQCGQRFGAVLSIKGK